MSKQASIFCAGFASATMMMVFLENFRKRREKPGPPFVLSEGGICRTEAIVDVAAYDATDKPKTIEKIQEPKRSAENQKIDEATHDTDSLSGDGEDESDTNEPPFNHFAWHPLEYSVLFGVVGGLGPRAMTYFLEGLVTERCKLFHAMHKGRTPEERLELTLKVSSARWTLDEVRKVYVQTRERSQLLDQDHIPILAAQATTVPPRPKFILKQSDIDPLPQLISVTRGLVNAGATHLVVNCNTAHHFWPRVKDYMHIPNVEFLDMVRITLEYVAQLTQNSLTPVGLFATTATIRTELYQEVGDTHFSLRMVSPLDHPDGDFRQKCIEKVIFGEKGIKSGYDNPDRQEEARMGLQALILEALQLKRAFETTIVILACSELPLILNDDSFVRWIDKIGLSDEDVKEVSKMQFIDPGKVITHEMLRLALLSRRIRFL